MDVSKKNNLEGAEQIISQIDNNCEADNPDRQEIPLEYSYKEMLLVAKDTNFKAILNFHFSPMGYAITHMDDPLAIINRIENIDWLEKHFPDIIIFNAIDYPRHWKPLLKLIREKKSHEESIFILIGSPDFHFYEAAKAAFLEANAIVAENLYKRNAISQLYEIIKRYKSIDEKRKYIRYIPKKYEHFKFLFTHPVKKYFVNGSITDISLAGACVSPSEPALTADLIINQSLPACSLRVGEDILTVNCRIVHIGEDLGLEFESLESKGHQKLFHYLMEIPRREMKAQI